MDKRNSLQRHQVQRWLPAFSPVWLVAVAVALLSLCSSATSFAQGNGAGNGAKSNSADSRPSRELNFEGSVVVSERPDARPAPRPDAGTNRGPSSGGHDRIDRGGVGAGTGGVTGPTPDPYPALTAANNAYTAAVTEWRRAEEDYASKHAHYMRMREKYCDETGEVRPGWDRSAAVIVLETAYRELKFAEIDLGQAKSALNGARSNVAREFRTAREQFERAQQAAEQARVAEQERQRRESAQQQRYDRRGDRGR
jgi:hypothetical protein